MPVDGDQVPLVAPLGQLPLQLLPRQLLPLQHPLLVVLALAPVPPAQRPLQRPEEAQAPRGRAANPGDGRRPGRGGRPGSGGRVAAAVMTQRLPSVAAPETRG